MSPATNILARPTPPPSSSSTGSGPTAMPSMHSSGGPPSHPSFPPPLFAAPMPPPAVSASAPAPHPFSAESLFQSSKGLSTLCSLGEHHFNTGPFVPISPAADQADLLRRELDNRFLDRAGLTGAVPPSPYLRQELHHHQHQHTHLHQHQQLLTPAPPAPAPHFPPPLFKDIPKMGAVDSPFYRTGLGLPAAYAGYSAPGLLHPGLAGATPFVPPSHLPSFAPKVSFDRVLWLRVSSQSSSSYTI